MSDMNGQVAIITGSSSGIGAATAELFASLGCRLTLTARRKQQLEEVKEKCVKQGLKSDDVLTVIADIGKMDQLDPIIDETVAKFGQIDYLINNAGMIYFKGVKLLTEDEFDTIMNVNVKSAQFLTKKALPYLRKTKGCIVNVSSDSGFRPAAMCTTYCMSKAAMNMMTKCVAADFAVYGIRVNAICPGIIDTPVYAGTIMAEMPESSATLPPVGRVGKPIEIARMVRVLCSGETGGFMTGAVIVMDGGDCVSTILPPEMRELERRMCGQPPYDQ